MEKTPKQKVRKRKWCQSDTYIYKHTRIAGFGNEQKMNKSFKKENHENTASKMNNKQKYKHKCKHNKQNAVNTTQHTKRYVTKYKTGMNKSILVKL